MKKIILLMSLLAGFGYAQDIRTSKIPDIVPRWCINVQGRIDCNRVRKVALKEKCINKEEYEDLKIKSSIPYCSAMVALHHANEVRLNEDLAEAKSIEDLTESELLLQLLGWCSC